jgi:predicted TIM-barrel fold metal-dependent hydrolase
MNPTIILLTLLLITPISCHKSSPESSDVVSKRENLHNPATKGNDSQKRELIIDSHVHISPTMTSAATALEVFDQAGIGRFVVKSAGEWGTPRYNATLAMQRLLGSRMSFFTNIQWEGTGYPGFIEERVRRLGLAKKDGALGVKIFKALGLSVRMPDGSLLPVNSTYLDPIFEEAGKLGLIVAMHTADPVAFFQPITKENERYEELSLAPGWSFYGEDYPSHEELLAQRDARIARHPGTKFLLIHLANYPEDLDYVDKLLGRFPNVWVDTSARIPEIGRHPSEEVKAFFIKHQNRILFGSDFISNSNGMQLGSVSRDGPPEIKDAVEFYRRHWEFFETDHRQVPHPTPIQGPWVMDCISLPLSVLEKIYRTNAIKLMFSNPETQPTEI